MFNDVLRHEFFIFEKMKKPQYFHNNNKPLLSINFVPDSVLSLHIVSHNKLRRSVLLLYLFYIWGNQGCKRLINLPKTTHLMKSGAEIFAPESIALTLCYIASFSIMKWLNTFWYILMIGYFPTFKHHAFKE